MRKIKFVIIFLTIFLALSTSFWWYLNQINKNSSKEDIQKLQQLFQELWLYTWSVNWDYREIEKTIIKYQVINKIIPNSKSSGAWYFGNKTIRNLESNFWDKFLRLKDKYLKLKDIEVWEKRSFITTAYYTPIRWQKKYYRWSYEKDIALQWNGRTASWKPAKIWTISAPRNYKFWTKIYLDWIWVWEVQDRGWSIRWNRIDIWMWEWDIWRQRAIKRGKRKLNWTIVSSNEKINMEFDEKNFFVRKEIKQEETKKDTKIKEDQSSKPSDKLSERKKQVIRLARDMIIKILKKRTKSEDEFKTTVKELKKDIKEMEKWLSENKKQILKYLISIL